MENVDTSEMTPVKAMPRAVKATGRDNVAVALEALVGGDAVDLAGDEVTLCNDVPAGHKLALVDIECGAPVHRYGFPIGVASRVIRRGEHVHSHNLVTALRGEAPYQYTPANRARNVGPSRAPRLFQGYLRQDGQVGTRNEIWIIPTVGCVGRTAERLASRAREALAVADGVHAFPHPFGCSQLGDDLEATSALIAALAQHPNAGAVLLIGLGCESNQMKPLLERLPSDRLERVRTIGAQSESDEMTVGMAALEELSRIVARDRRTAQPLSRLRLGVKCGGSDGLSGITANPLIGRISDAVTEAGGSVVLTEIPEMFGAEQMLLNRCVDQSVFDRLAALVNGFKRYFIDHGEPISENPSPGNIRGGITTLEEKSLGAVQKGGQAPVADVIGYAQRAMRQGLTILEAPGNDAVSTTALAAAGATVTLFSTGRGTPLGNPVPTIKISSNSTLAQAKPNWIDFDGGLVLSLGSDGAADGLLDQVVAVASGRRTQNERNDERSIGIWKRGVTL